MRIKDIVVGGTYSGKGSGRTKRRVIAIGDEHRPIVFLSNNSPPDEPGVLFSDSSRNGFARGNLYISSFAKWCGKRVA